MESVTENVCYPSGGDKESVDYASLGTQATVPDGWQMKSSAYGYLRSLDWMRSSG